MNFFFPSSIFNCLFSWKLQISIRDSTLFLTEISFIWHPQVHLYDPSGQQVANLQHTRNQCGGASGGEGGIIAGDRIVLYKICLQFDMLLFWPEFIIFMCQMPPFWPNSHSAVFTYPGGSTTIRKHFGCCDTLQFIVESTHVRRNYLVLLYVITYAYDNLRI